MVSDLISRQQAIDALDKHIDTFDAIDKNYLSGLRTAMSFLKEMPPAQPERKKGKWIPVTNGRGGFECDECHNYAPSFQDGVEWLSDYCPNCGADMRGERDV